MMVSSRTGLGVVDVQVDLNLRLVTIPVGFILCRWCLCQFAKVEAGSESVDLGGVILQEDYANEPKGKEASSQPAPNHISPTSSFLVESTTHNRSVIIESGNSSGMS